jgi:hypothetical protein
MEILPICPYSHIALQPWWFMRLNKNWSNFIWNCAKSCLELQTWWTGLLIDRSCHLPLFLSSYFFFSKHSCVSSPIMSINAFERDNDHTSTYLNLSCFLRPIYIILDQYLNWASVGWLHSSRIQTKLPKRTVYPLYIYLNLINQVFQ